MFLKSKYTKQYKKRRRLSSPPLLTYSVVHVRQDLSKVSVFDFIVIETGKVDLTGVLADLGNISNCLILMDQLIDVPGRILPINHLVNDDGIGVVAFLEPVIGDELVRRILPLVEAGGSAVEQQLGGSSKANDQVAGLLDKLEKLAGKLLIDLHGDIIRAIIMKNSALVAAALVLSS